VNGALAKLPIPFAARVEGMVKYVDDSKDCDKTKLTRPFLEQAGSGLLVEQAYGGASGDRGLFAKATLWKFSPTTEICSRC
jgi:hypothetical protein